VIHRVRFKKLLISSMLCCIFVIVFGTATYAWVSMARINNLEGLTLTASTADELEISYDGLSYQTNLEGYHREGLYLKDVTSTDGFNFTRGPQHLFEEALVHDDYISFDLYFRSTRIERGLYLVNNIKKRYDEISEFEKGTYVTSRGMTFVPSVHYAEENHSVVEAYTARTYYAKDAIRMSFSEMINDEIHQTIIFDPSENAQRGYGEPFGAYSYFIARTNANVALPEDKPDTIYQLSMMDPQNPYQALTNDSLIAQMQPSDMFDEDGKRYYFAKVRIHLWIEGWDADAIDGILKDIVRVQLEFKLAHPV